MKVLNSAIKQMENQIYLDIHNDAHSYAIEQLLDPEPKSVWQVRVLLNGEDVSFGWQL